MWNGLVIALDKLGGGTPQSIINYMKNNHFNALRIYTGWGSSMYTGNVDDPVNSATQNFLSQILTLAGQEGFLVVLSVAAQYGVLYQQFPDEGQRGWNGEQSYGAPRGGYMCPSGQNYRVFLTNVIRKYLEIAKDKVTVRWISLDEIQFVSAGTSAGFYSESMKAAWRNAKQKEPVNVPRSGTWTPEQQEYADFCRDMIENLHRFIAAVTAEADPEARFGALLDAYWVEGKYINDTQPWGYYATLNNLVFERFYTILNQNWTEFQTDLTRITNLNPSARKYFIYGRVTYGVSNVRQAVQIVKDNGYDGIFLYEYYDVRNTAFDVSDITGSETPLPPPPPVQPPPECYTNNDCLSLFGANWECQNGTCVYVAPPPPPPKSGMGIYYLLPPKILRWLWRMREKHIGEELHSKLHPLV